MGWDEREIIKKNHKYSGPHRAVASLSGGTVALDRESPGAAGGGGVLSGLGRSDTPIRIRGGSDRHPIGKKTKESDESRTRPGFGRRTTDDPAPAC